MLKAALKVTGGLLGIVTIGAGIGYTLFLMFK